MLHLCPVLSTYDARCVLADPAATMCHFWYSPQWTTVFVAGHCPAGLNLLSFHCFGYWISSSISCIWYQFLSYILEIFSGHYFFFFQILLEPRFLLISDCAHAFDLGFTATLSEFAFLKILSSELFPILSISVEIFRLWHWLILTKITRAWCIN